MLLCSRSLIRWSDRESKAWTGILSLAYLGRKRWRICCDGIAQIWQVILFADVMISSVGNRLWADWHVAKSGSHRQLLLFRFMKMGTMSWVWSRDLRVRWWLFGDLLVCDSGVRIWESCAVSIVNFVRTHQITVSSSNNYSRHRRRQWGGTLRTCLPPPRNGKKCRNMML